MALVAKLPEINVQLGPLVDSALSVRQIPPPAAATHRRQFVVLQLGAMASAVMRPEAKYCDPLYVRIEGTFVVVGPISVHEAATTASSPLIAMVRVLR